MRTRRRQACRQCRCSRGYGTARTYAGDVNAVLESVARHVWRSGSGGGWGGGRGGFQSKRSTFGSGALVDVAELAMIPSAASSVDGARAGKALAVMKCVWTDVDV